jgi:hypothetical protein
MDTLTKDDILLLGLPGESGEHVSLFLPTHRFGGEAHTDPLRFRNLLNGVESVLAERGMGRSEIDQLLAPAWALNSDAMAWKHMRDGLAVYLRRDWLRVFRVPVNVPELATIGDKFVVGPLVRLLSGDERFLLLALSQRRVRLLEGSRDRVEQLELGEVPTSLREVTEPAEPRSHTMARPLSGAGRGGPAVFYGHGAREASDRKDEVRRFLHQVGEGVRDVLGNQDVPMVLVGLPELLAMYREVKGYPHVVAEMVEKNPDELSAQELHDAAWPIIARGLEEKSHVALAQMADLEGTGRASTNPEAIGEAAAQGRVSMLFLPSDPGCWDPPSAGSPHVVQLGTDDTFAPCELLDQAAVDTLTRGGEIHTLPDGELPGPGRGDVAAILRY